MKIVAMIPTYNESGNIKKLANDILSLGNDYEVLVVDDNSPDGTHKVVAECSKQNPKIHLLLRTERKGRGWAGIDGFKKAVEMGADIVVEMDGDGSHAAKFIPQMVAMTKNADVVVGSRYIAGGKDENRSMLRQLISGFARKYLSFVLGTSVEDATSGFRVFKKDVLVKIVPYLKAQDPFIVAEVLFWVKKYGFKVSEAPIEFMQRETGESKLKPSTLIKYLLRVWKLRLGN